MEHLRARATERAAYDVADTIKHRPERNSTVPAPVSAPLGRWCPHCQASIRSQSPTCGTCHSPTLADPPADTPTSHLRNALQIIELGRVTIEGVERYSLDSTELEGVRHRIVSALAQLEDRDRRRGAFPGLEVQLREMERTNRELAGDPSVLLEISGAGSGE